MSVWTKEALRLCQTESGKSMMHVTALELLRKVQSPVMPAPLYEEKKLGEEGGGVVKVETEN